MGSYLCHAASFPDLAVILSNLKVRRQFQGTSNVRIFHILKGILPWYVALNCNPKTNYEVSWFSYYFAVLVFSPPPTYTHPWIFLVANTQNSLVVLFQSHFLFNRVSSYTFSLYIHAPPPLPPSLCACTFCF